MTADSKIGVKVNPGSRQQGLEGIISSEDLQFRHVSQVGEAEPVLKRIISRNLISFEVGEPVCPIIFDRLLDEKTGAGNTIQKIRFSEINRGQCNLLSQNEAGNESKCDE